MLLLRHMPGSEARELLTHQVATAADLCGVLRRRIGRALAQMRRAARHAAQLRVDDNGLRHAALLAANAARNAARNAELVDLARHLARQAAESELSRASVARRAGFGDRSATGHSQLPRSARCRTFTRCPAPFGKETL
ncbi:hypothetical protein GBF35_31370 [Nonomuraea phyllanthi]|uniref:hypothetical protein n=1 Tax=Nonomuraea phyllanthi TaxID=2219224 RepID=UPI001293071A|nr:hypothetical protein [Nonomuraea phyllanthi]QFY10514.1 hypothetical protein GBF35_31370 [Nonomuraea phyllanthi]